jgi:hypothetical protein
MVPTATENTGAQYRYDQQLDRMKSSQAESQEPSNPKVKGSTDDENALLESSSTDSVSVGNMASSEGYCTDCSSDQQLDSENDGDSDGMPSSQAESEELSDPIVTASTDENVFLVSSSNGSFSNGNIASSGEGYRSDCSACSDQGSDQSFDCTSSGQKQKSTMKLTLNRFDLKYTSTEVESSSRQGGSSLGDEATEPGTISSVSKAQAQASSNTAKTSLRQ